MRPLNLDPMRYSLALLLAAALLPVAAPAQEIPSPFRYVERTQAAGAFAGYLQTQRGEFGIGAHSAPIFGARYDIRFSGPLSGEVALGAIPTQRTVVQRVVAAGDSATLRDLADVDAFILNAEAGLRFNVTGPRTWHGLAPYAVLTGGLFMDLAGSTELEESIEATQRVELGPAFAATGGIGADWFLSERLALRIDARDHVWRITAPEGLTGTRQRESAWTHNLAFTLGASFHF